MNKLNEKKITKHYRDISFLENRARLKLLQEFQRLVIQYFENSTLNMLSGAYNEKPEAREAREAINVIIKTAYSIIRYADIKTYTASITSLSAGGRGGNMDVILNIFNLGRNNIEPNAVIDYIDSAVSVYKSNRLPSLIRTINPFFWLAVIFRYR